MAQKPTVTVARFCAIESRFCEKTLVAQPFPSAFLAYPSGKHWSEMMRELARKLRASSMNITTWEDTTTGGVIFTKVCDAILTHTFTICEISDLNPNVLFEAGYALANNRDAILLVDNTKVRKQFPTLGTKESCYYSTREDIETWLKHYIDQIPMPGDGDRPPSVLELNGIADASETTGALYYLRPRTTTSTVLAIQEQLAKSPFIVATADPFDTTFDDFYYQARQIQESELVVGLLSSSDIKQSTEDNASVALLLGLAVGFGKRVLVIQELPHSIMLDVGTMLKMVEGESTAKATVERWVNSQVPDLVRRRPTSLETPVGAKRTPKIQELFLGSPDAMADYNLMQYFVTTTEYRQARNGVKQLLIGRKGAGKSATFQALLADLAGRKTGCVVSLAPADFQFERLTGFLEDQFSLLNHALVYQSYWKYIILTEILKVINERHNETEASPFLQTPVPKHVERLIAFISEQRSVLELDFASRATQTLTALQELPVGGSNAENQAALEKVLLKARMYQIEKDLQAFAKDYPITLLIDDIDKHWNPSYQASVYLLLGLVNETAHLHTRFRDALNVALFLRQDIFEFLRTVDEDIFKRDVIAFVRDEESLLNMVAERIRVRLGIALDSDKEVWTRVFPGTVAGVTGWHYVVERSLMRPRDVLQFCQGAIEKAQIHRHDRVLESDLLEAEREYSYNSLKGLRLEYYHIYPHLDEVAFEFLAWKSQGTFIEAVQFVVDVVLKGENSKTTWVQDCIGDPERLLAILYAVGFCGIGDSQRDLLFYSFQRPFDEAKKLCFSEPYIVIHPAFRSALELK